MQPAQQKLIQFLQSNGLSSSTEIQNALQVSQPTVSRLLESVDDVVVVCGRGKQTRYAVAQPIGTAAAQQAIWCIQEDGLPTRLGTLRFLARSQIHIEADGVNTLFEPTLQAQLPWYLSALRAQGFLGRLLAQKLAALGVPANPELWDAEAVLLAALHTHDAPGALLLGDVHPPTAATSNAMPSTQPITLPMGDGLGNELGEALDRAASDVAKTLRLGSSAGGEQPKFLAHLACGESVLVKFSPPRGTPFGDRWHDLLCAEALCSAVLQRHGHDTAHAEIVQSASRTYLLSRRFDRLGAYGRRHIVSVDAAHTAFVKGGVKGGYTHWAATADVLAQQGRLPQKDAQTLHALLQFGHLIGNTDMHSGNAGLFVHGTTLREISKGQFSLAPVYDMLPMRWRPDPVVGLVEYAPFDVDFSLADAATRTAARAFWIALAEHPLVSAPLQTVAATMVDRMGWRG
jgi:hypothetical protein